jgi:hypothetical protein
LIEIITGEKQHFLDTNKMMELALTSPTSGGRSVGIVRLRTTGHGVFVLSFF